MGFKDDFERLITQVSQRKQHCGGNEEATKQALILPFLQVLGYDIYNPTELVPEYKAGWANKEKVDYAVFIDEKPAIFIEAKAFGEKLINYDAQLAKYFNSTPDVKIAIITDGITYKFFTDGQQLNIMSEDPLFEFNIEELKKQDYEVLDRLRKDNFEVDSIITEAENLFYLNGFMKRLKQNFNNPGEDFIKFVASDIYPSRMTSKALERLQPLVKQAVSTTLVAMVSKGLTHSIDEEDSEDDAPASEEGSKNESKIKTTEQELEAYNAIVQIIEGEFGSEHEINYKDTQSYFSVQMQKPSRWFCRLHFNNLKRIYVAFRIPEEAAKALVDPSIVETYSSSTTDGCSITYETLADLDAMKPVLLAAYASISKEFQIGAAQS